MPTAKPTQPADKPWAGRLAATAITLFIVLVLTLMFLAVRGPR
jgi:hypothetical protein